MTRRELLQRMSAAGLVMPLGATMRQRAQPTPLVTPWSLVAHTAAVGSASAVTTPPISTVGASLIVVISGGQLTLTPTDSLANTNWYAPPKQASASGYGMWISFIVNPITGAAHTFTLSGGGSAYPWIAVLAFAGSFYGAERVTGAYAGAASLIQPGAITPSANGALIVTGYSNSSGTTAPAITAPFTLADSVPAGANGGPAAAAYLVQTTAAAVNPTWLNPGGTLGSVAQMQSFVMPPAGSSGGPCAAGLMLPYSGE